MDNLVGALAIATLGIVILVVGFVYLRSLRSGRNMDAARTSFRASTRTWSWPT